MAEQKLHPTKELESQILGYLMNNESSFELVHDLELTSDDFSIPGFKLIFETMKKFETEGKRFGMIELATALPDLAGLITGLSVDAPLSLNIGGLIKELSSQSWIKRLALGISEIQSLALSREAWSDIGETKDLIQGKFEQLIEGVRETLEGPKRISEVTDDSIMEIERRIELAAQGKRPGITTGINAIDFKLNGFQDGFFYIIGGRPGMGKSSLALNLATNGAKSGANVYLACNEMQKTDLHRMILSKESQVTRVKIESGTMTDEECDRLIAAARNIHNLPMILDDSTRGSWDRLKNRIRRLHKKGQADIVFIDYLQQFRYRSKNFKDIRNELNEISNEMKQLALQLKIPIVALVQLSRATEHRKDPTPSMSDIKETGNIEQDADGIFFVFRKSYYDEEADPTEADLLVAKNRRGPCGRIKLFCNIDRNFFGDPRS